MIRGGTACENKKVGHSPTRTTTVKSILCDLIKPLLITNRQPKYQPSRHGSVIRQTLRTRKWITHTGKAAESEGSVQQDTYLSLHGRYADDEVNIWDKTRHTGVRATTTTIIVTRTRKLPVTAAETPVPASRAVRTWVRKRRSTTSGSAAARRVRTTLTTRAKKMRRAVAM